MILNAPWELRDLHRADRCVPGPTGCLKQQLKDNWGTLGHKGVQATNSQKSLFLKWSALWKHLEVLYLQFVELPWPGYELGISLAFAVQVLPELPVLLLFWPQSLDGALSRTAL